MAIKDKEPRVRNSDPIDVLAFDDFTSQLNQGSGPVSTLNIPANRFEFTKLVPPTLHGFVYQMNLGMRFKRELRFFKTEINGHIYPALCIYTKDTDDNLNEKYFYITVRCGRRLLNYSLYGEGSLQPLHKDSTPLVIFSFFKGFDIRTYRLAVNSPSYDGLLRGFLDERVAMRGTKQCFRMMADYTTGYASWLEWRDFICWCRTRNSMVEQERRAAAFA